jgi:hypothetical protein
MSEARVAEYYAGTEEEGRRVLDSDTASQRR